jgi:hypothetical protein
MAPDSPFLPDKANSMTHPMVEQLRFTRGEFRRGLEGLAEADAARRFLPMNCISWNIGHLAAQENKWFLQFAQGKNLHPSLNEQFGYGAPACTPALADVLPLWEAVTREADPWLETLDANALAAPMVREGMPFQTLLGTAMQRVIYHYWYHCGENLAIRQNLGQTGLPQFVGDIDNLAPYRAG